MSRSWRWSRSISSSSRRRSYCLDHATLGRRAPAFLERLRQFIELEGRLFMLWLFIVIGAYLTLDAIRYFA